jgi:hypothetical protein
MFDWFRRVVMHLAACAAVTVAATAAFNALAAQGWWFNEPDFSAGFVAAVSHYMMRDLLWAKSAARDE